MNAASPRGIWMIQTDTGQYAARRASERLWKGVVSMYYDNLPLYPSLCPGWDQESCVRLPVFDTKRCGHGRMPDACQCQRIIIENPCRPGERAEVLLGVDDCGNLAICVRRDPCRERDCRPSGPDCHPRPDCLPPRPCLPDCRPPIPCPPPRRGCRGRLYGSWR